MREMVWVLLKLKLSMSPHRISPTWYKLTKDSLIHIQVHVCWQRKPICLHLLISCVFLSFLATSCDGKIFWDRSCGEISDSASGLCMCGVWLHHCVSPTVTWGNSIWSLRLLAFVFYCRWRSSTDHNEVWPMKPKDPANSADSLWLSVTLQPAQAAASFRLCSPQVWSM